MMSKQTLLALLYCLIQPAYAQTNQVGFVDYAQEADLRFNMGIEAFNEQNYLKAIAHFLLSNRLAPNPNVEFNIAYAYEMLEEYDQALTHYENVSRDSSDEELKQMANEAIERLSPKCALLHIDSEPQGAEVYIDKKSLGMRGRTPLHIALPQGDHQLYLELDGYYTPSIKLIQLEQGKELEHSFRLTPITTSVTIIGNPIGASVYAEGQNEELCKIPCEVKLSPGFHFLELKKDGYKDTTEQIFLTLRQRTIVRIEMELKTGHISVTSDLEGAQVYVDDQPYGTVPVHLDNITVGSHKIKVTQEDSIPVLYDIDVYEDEEVEIHAKMKPLPEKRSHYRTQESPDALLIPSDVISEREIHAFGYQSLYDAMLSMRGVSGKDLGFYKSLNIRGISLSSDYGSHLQLTQNDHIMSDMITGWTPFDQGFMTSLSDVRRIELLRGPIASLNGPDATLGSIRVLTNDEQNDVRPQIEVVQPEDRSLRIRAAGSHRFLDKGGFWISGEHLLTQGYDYTYPLIEERTTITNKGEDKQQFQNISGQIWYGDLSLEIAHKHRDATISTPFKHMKLTGQSVQLEQRQSYVELKYTPDEDANLRLLSRIYFDHKYIDADLPYMSEYGGQNEQRWNAFSIGAEEKLIVHSSDRGLNAWLSLDGQYQLDAQLKLAKETQQSIDRSIDANFISLAGQAQYRLFDPLELAAGTRLSLYDGEDFAFLPFISAKYQVNHKSTFTLLHGQSVRHPNIKEKYAAEDNHNLQQEERLKSERAWNLELVYAHQFNRSIRAETSVYYTRLEDPITLKWDSSTLNATGYTNQSKPIQTIGGEFALKYDWLRNLFFEFNYSYQHTRTDALMGDDLLLDSPAHLANLKFVLPVPRFGLLVANRLHYESPRELFGHDNQSEHLLYWDVILSGSDPIGDHVMFSMGLKNILDQRAHHAGSADLNLESLPQQGRVFYLQLRGML